jgi:hypothetical protein
VTEPAGKGTEERRYLLWDASAVIPYYVHEASKSPRSALRIRTIIDAYRHGHVQAHFYLPNIVVAEVFTTLARHCYSHWDPQIYKKYGGPGRALHATRYQSARTRFRRDIHNGALFYQYDLNRYHILALDLIAPVDKARKFYRRSGVRSMGASDLLIGAMALHLTRIHGRERVALVTTDHRMRSIFETACRSLKSTSARKLGLIGAATDFGFGDWSGSLYPLVLDLHSATDKQLAAFFGAWPLETKKRRGVAPRA